MDLKNSNLFWKSVAKAKLEALRKTCETNKIPSQNRMVYLLSESPEDIEKEEISFLEPYLTSTDEKTSILVLKVLCRFGYKIEDLYVRFSSLSSQLRAEVMKQAFLQNSPETILEMVTDDEKNVNTAIILLKKMGREDLFASFLFSQNEELVNLIKKVAK